MKLELSIMVEIDLFITLDYAGRGHKINFKRLVKAPKDLEALKNKQIK